MDLRSDLRDAWRLARHEPGFAATAIFTVALGVGAATVLFSLVYGVLLRPLPWPGADRLVRVSETRQGATRNFPGAMTNGAYLAWADRPSTLDGLAAWTTDKATLASAGGAPERVDVISVTPSLFPLLRVEPLLGVVFKAGDELEGRPPVVVLSHALWQQRFGSDPHIVGRLVQLDGQATTVVAVMPASFTFPNADARAWAPFLVHGVQGDAPGSSYLQLFQAMGRLRGGRTAAEATAEGTLRARQVTAQTLVGMAVFGTKGPADVHAVPALDAITADVRQPLLLFLAAVGLLVLTATANVASLQLVRASARRRETAIRSALGAGAGRLARPMIVESLALGLLGGAAGLGVALGLHRLLPLVMPPRFPRLDDVHVDMAVAGFAMALSLVSAVVFGVVPSFLGRRVDLVAALNEDGLAPAGGGARTAASRARRAIIVGQVAIASVLLVGGLLLAESFVRLLRADRGYNPANVLTAQLTLPDATYDGARRMRLMDRTLDELRALPGVTAAAAGTGLPFSSREMLTAFTMPASTPGRGPAEVHAAMRHVSDGWFAALGIRLIAGRVFTAADSRTSRPVAIVNRTFAHEYLGEHPIGRTLPLGVDGGAADWEVVGVVENVRQREATERLQPEIFVDYRQLPKAFDASEASFVVRTASAPASYADALRRLVRAKDDGLAFDSMVTLEDRLRDSLAEPRLYALLLVAFAVSALIVAGVGLFAVLSYSVSQRAREIGVRSAIGARPIDIVRLVMGQALGLAAAGVGLGLLLAAAAVRALSGFLYGIGPYDPATLTLSVAVLLVVTLVAAVLPARRAARVDPITAIRQA